MKNIHPLSAGFIAASTLLTSVTLAGASPAEAKSRNLLPSSDEVVNGLEALKQRSNADLLQGFTRKPVRVQNDGRELQGDAEDGSFDPSYTKEADAVVEVPGDTVTQVLGDTGTADVDVEIETFDKNFPDQEVEYVAEDGNRSQDADDFPISEAHTQTTETFIYPASRGLSIRSGTSTASMEKQLMEMINRERARHGLRPLAWDGRLCRVGRDHSQDMARRHYFSHYSPEGTSVMDRALARGIDFQTLGENLALDFSAQSAHNSLMRSRAHRDNILCRDYSLCGIGVAISPRGELLVTEVFVG